MRIACIASSQIPSTTANSIQVMKASHALAQLGPEVRLWVPGESSASWSSLKTHYGLEQEFDIHWEPSQKMLRRYDLAIHAINQAVAWKADLVYTWLPQAAVLAGVRKVPAVLEMHDLPTGRLGPHLFRQFVRQRSRKRLAVITQALYDRLRAAHAFDLPPDEFCIAPNGSDVERYAGLPSPAAARQQLGLPQAFTAGYTGHFYQGRGIQLLEQLAAALPEIQFLFVGGQPSQVASFRDRLKKAGLHNTIATGFVENAALPLYQAAADVLLMPYELSVAGSSGGNSAEICSPMKMFDYLAAGRPILTSDLPVFHEVLSEHNAVFCPANDPVSWQAALQALSADPERCRALGDQARQDAARYSWTTRARMVLAGFM